MIEDRKDISEELSLRVISAKELIAKAALEGNWDKAQAITAAAKQLEELTSKLQ